MFVNKLNQLVSVDSTLQRLRDVAGNLMLADRQQEELVNYVNGFMKNFIYSSMISLTPVDSSDYKEVYLPYAPIIKDVSVYQGYMNRSYYNMPFLGYQYIENDLSSNDYIYFLFVSKLWWMAELNGSSLSKAIDVKGVLGFGGDDGSSYGFMGKLTDTSPLVTEHRLFLDFEPFLDLPFETEYDFQSYSLSFTGLKIRFAKKV